MYSTAALTVAGGHLDDLYAEASRERLVKEIRGSGGRTGRRSPLEWLRVGADRLRRVMRALPRVAAR